MRIRMYWWGALFIPENDRDLEVLESFPEPELYYDSYSGEHLNWVTEHKEFNGANRPETYVDLPLGKALELAR